MIAIVDTGGANHASIQNALTRLGQNSVVTLDKTVLADASHLILPGVGHAGHAMKRLEENNLIEFLRKQTKPLLGICLGLQILFEASEEGDVNCLGLLPGTVTRMKPTPEFRVPHMGWSQLTQKNKSVLLDDVDPKAYFYFVHSYRAPETTATVAAFRTDAAADKPIPAVVEKGHIFATQFHPERSSEAGARILQNFISWGPQ